MPPNAMDIPMGPDTDNGEFDRNKAPSAPPANFNKNYGLEIFQYCLNLLAHILTGVIVGTVILFIFRFELPLAATPLHICLCVFGYQLLMAQAILSLASSNGWSLKLRLVDKRRAHWILQILGSGLAIIGSIIKILDKEIHWNTLHGQFGLVALVFTTVCLVNGLASLYAYELRKFLPGNLSKLTHICFGTVAFTAASICLCYGFDKAFFRSWALDTLTSTIIAFTVIHLVIVIINPFITFYNKASSIVKK